MNNSIIEIENGPLMLEDNLPILVKDGKIINSKSPTYLCRCGASMNKPFCDGEHQKKGFTSKKEITEELLYEYKGKEININFNRSICAGAGACVRGLPSVFVSGGGKNWIHPENDSIDKITNTVNACPSGALSYTLKSKTHIDTRKNPKITIIKDGPYNVEGVLCAHKQKPTKFSETKYTLCRCGYSKNKPYCDYSHAQKKWSDE